MFKTGDYAFDKPKNERIQILERYEVWGFVSYKVFNLISNSIYKLPEEQISISSIEDNIDINYIRYITLLSKIKNEIATGILSNLSSGIIPLPHQIHVLNRAVSNNKVRYILADEVGLGKTIEAGLIIKELKARGLVKRVLIVCPKGLVTQWGQEMKDKFGEKFHVILPEDYETIRKLTDNEDVYGQFEQVISPMDSIKPLERRTGWNSDKLNKYNEERIYSIINSGWDLVVIDEAHRVAGSSGEVARHKLGSLLSSASPYLLLLTATPHNGKTEPFLRLIRLLDEKAFPNFKAIVKEQVAPYIIRTEKREAIDNAGNKLFKKRSTKVIELHWDERHSLQKELYELVSNYVAKGYNKAVRNRGKFMWLIFLLIMMQRLVTSSTSAIRQSLEKRLNILEEQDFKMSNLSEEELAEMNIEESIEDAVKAISLDIKAEISELSEIVAVAKQAEFQYMDVKVEPFIEIIDNLFSENKDCKVIVFTEFVSTQDYLSNFLVMRGYTTSLLNGSMSIDERNAVLLEFKTKTNILISTDAGGEGLNLQFSNVVINYDLPWNPMKIEQRIGRVDRIGQQKDVLIFNFVLADTVENRVKDVLEQKLSLILEEVGIDKYGDVLDNELSEMNFTDAYMNSIRNPKDITFSVRKIEEDLKTQVQNARNFKDIIYEEKDLTSLLGTGSNFDIEDALMRMVTYYQNYLGNPYFPVKNFSINDSQILEHLNKETKYVFEAGILSVDIRDFPNEKGYFLLWEISLTDKPNAKKIIPVFVNENYVLRPLAGKKIWDEIISATSKISFTNKIQITKEIYDKISDISKEFAYETFLEMKSAFEQKNEENYRKYLYALDLRIEAASNIGIPNIKSHKLANLSKEKLLIEAQYKAGRQICPEFKPVFIAFME